MTEFQEVMRQWTRRCEHCDAKENVRCYVHGYTCKAFRKMKDCTNFKSVEEEIMKWAAEHPEPVYETWFEYLLRIGVIPENAPAGGEYQWIVESIKHKHISNDIAESLKLHPKEVQA